MESSLKHLSEYMTAARIKRHLTQEKLSELSGISLRSIRGVENGSRNPSFLLLFALTKALDVPVEPIFQEEGLTAPMQVELLNRSYYASNAAGQKAILALADAIAQEMPCEKNQGLRTHNYAHPLKNSKTAVLNLFQNRRCLLYTLFAARKAIDCNGFFLCRRWHVGATDYVIKLSENKIVL